MIIFHGLFARMLGTASMIICKCPVAIVLSVMLAGTVDAQERVRQARTADLLVPELLVVVVSAGYCQDSQRTDFRESIEGMRASLTRVAAERGRTFAVVGVAVDRLVAEGLQHLERFAPFDQVIVGGGWTNLASVELVGLRPTGDTTIPQVLVIERIVRRGNRTIQVSSERLVRRVTGVDAIVRWANEGFPLK